MRSALVASALAACTPHGEDTEVPGHDDDIRPSLSTDRVQRPDRVEPAPADPPDATHGDSCESSSVPRQSVEPEQAEFVGLVARMGKRDPRLPEAIVSEEERARLLELERRLDAQAGDPGPR